jgi:hypothetical protein
MIRCFSATKSIAPPRCETKVIEGTMLAMTQTQGDILPLSKSMIRLAIVLALAALVGGGFWLLHGHSPTGSTVKQHPTPARSRRTESAVVIGRREGAASEVWVRSGKASLRMSPGKAPIIDIRAPEEPDIELANRAVRYALRRTGGDDLGLTDTEISALRTIDWGPQVIVGPEADALQRLYDVYQRTAPPARWLCEDAMAGMLSGLSAARGEEMKANAKRILAIVGPARLATLSRLRPPGSTAPSTGPATDPANR